MSKLRSRKWMLLSVFLGVSAFLGTFYVAYAGVVQWSREQPAAVFGVDVVPLDPSAMTLFQDHELTDELTEGELLEFGVLELQPPLDRLRIDEGASVNLWLRNDSDIPLYFLENCCQEIHDPVTDEFLGYVGAWLAECCNPIPPDEAKMIHIQVGIAHPGLIGQEFSIVVGALGETTEDGVGVTSISPQVQQFLDSTSKKTPDK